MSGTKQAVDVYISPNHGVWALFLTLLSHRPSFLCSFSFAPNNRWTSFFPQGSEMVKYLHEICDKYKKLDKIRLNADVSGLLWLEKERIWEGTLVYLGPGAGDLSAKERQRRVEKYGEKAVYLKRESFKAKIVVSCVVGLVEPKGWPEEIPGRECFAGDIFHSSRWNYDVDLTEKDVIVMGTGCGTAQFTALITKAPYNAKLCTQLMRSPPWVIPSTYSSERISIIPVYTYS